MKKPPLFLPAACLETSGECTLSPVSTAQVLSVPFICPVEESGVFDSVTHGPRLISKDGFCLLLRLEEQKRAQQLEGRH